MLLDNISKLRWACRRGMLELDVLLNNFLDKAYLDLPVTEKKLFIELLSCTDSELFVWLIGQETPRSKELAKITELIRSCKIKSLNSSLQGPIS